MSYIVLNFIRAKGYVCTMKCRFTSLSTPTIVLLPSWYAAWSKGILVFNLSQVRLMRQIVSNFLNTDKSISGRKFPGGPFFFPGFGSGVRTSGGFPSFAVVFNICAIFS